MKNENVGAALSLSSERFAFQTAAAINDDDETVEEIDQVIHLFTRLTKKPPTLEEALESMGCKKSKELTEKLTKEAEDKMGELDAPGLSASDVSVVLCYTYEWDAKELGKGTSPYRVLNNSLSVDRSNAALKKTRGFLFLLLQTLRKLPRFVPESHSLYRGLKILVQTEAGPKSPAATQHTQQPQPSQPSQPLYAVGRTKTWWAFTSTTTSLEVTQTFLGKTGGTLFVLGGEVWGYDISVFSDFPDEKEILLEPERKLRVTSTNKEGQLITVDAEMLDTAVIMSAVIKTPKGVKRVGERRSEDREAPSEVRATNVRANTVEVTWKPVRGRDVVYQAAVKKRGTLGRGASTAYEGSETRCTMEDLEALGEYEVHVRCRHRAGGFGRWSEKAAVRVINPPKGFTVRAVPPFKVRAVWEPLGIAGKDAVYQVKGKRAHSEGEPDVLWSGNDTSATTEDLEPDTLYNLWAQAGVQGEWGSAQGPVAVRTLPWRCVWAECPAGVDEHRRYSVDEGSDGRVAASTGDGHCTVVGSVPLPQRRFTYWDVRLLHLEKSTQNGSGAFVGVAPLDIDQNSAECNSSRCGWYILCRGEGPLELHSGPPHNVRGKAYGKGLLLRGGPEAGDTVSVGMNMLTGELVCSVHGTDLGVAYDAIPLDKPLVPCVIICNRNDSIELSS